ncbi:MAG: hypothetical protein E6K70_07690 [Planctomycetota bacterium]|nr:MAG: hypothetical protein E6K70_07690 [Planctomycetota bacterium]
MRACQKLLSERGTMENNVDRAVEELALRQHGMLGRGDEMGNALYAMPYGQLPPEALHVIQLIISTGPFPNPKDGSPYRNDFGDLPSRGRYLEFTVPTPGVKRRGKRRIVARSNGILFFTACHYDRVPGPNLEAQRAATAQVDEQWRNGFYVITGMPPGLRQNIAAGIARLKQLKAICSAGVTRPTV